MKSASSILLCIAQGLGSGRLKPAPGTWGSLVGVIWTLLLLLPGNPLFYLVVTLVTTVVAIPIATRAGRILNHPDSPSVVIDEIVALPIAFSGYALHWTVAGAGLPPLGSIGHWWPALLAAFLLFRLFDVWKPGPIGRLQELPEGTGVVLDDVAAALVSAVLLAVGTRVAFFVRLAMG